MKSVCLAILNYNGKKHLEHLLPTACAAARKFSGTCAVVVLDNQSTGDDVAWGAARISFYRGNGGAKKRFSLLLQLACAK